MSDGILEEIAALRQKCSTLNGEINDLVIKHAKKQDKISTIQDTNSEIKQLIQEMKEEISVCLNFDPDTARAQIRQLEQDIESIKTETKEFAIETKRLQEVARIKAQSRAKQNVYAMLKNRRYASNITPISTSSIVSLRHQLEEELNNLTAENVPYSKISRKKAQIIHLLDLTN